MVRSPMPSSTVEDYLKQILLLAQEGGDPVVPMGRVATALGVVPGTVTTMVKALADQGLADYEPRVGVRLSAEGERVALQMLRRHRLVELFLVQTLGLDWTEIHVEAEQLEHAISDRVLERIDALLGHPTADPHGDPIPDARGRVAAPASTSLADAAPGAKGRVLRVVDQGQEFLQFAEAQGLTPGQPVAVDLHDAQGDSVTVTLGDGRRVTLGGKAAAKILLAE